MTRRTALEDALAFQIKAAKLPEPVREHVFARPRRWRFDFAWPDRKLAVEVEGGIWAAGRHNRPLGMIADIEKYNAAILLGWRVLRAAGPHVKSGEALEWIEAALERKAA
jgi:very-short-patch-repair endonuclease